MGSFWERLFGKGARPAQARAANDGENDLLSNVRDQVRRDVRAGFYDRGSIVENAVSSFEDETDRPFLEIHARRYLDEELAAHQADQRLWPVPTDCDRLDSAFAALEANGVVSRQNFTCCGNCGSCEIWDEIAAVQQAGGPARGYAFYHSQDTDRAVDGEGLYLNYGACEEGEEAALAIAAAIVAELERHGLTASWDGSWSQRIAVPLNGSVAEAPEAQ